MKLPRRSIALLLTLLSTRSLALSANSPPNLFQKTLLKLGLGKHWREAVVECYFDGVQRQNRDQIVSCFAPSGTKIRDVGILAASTNNNKSERWATPDQLGDRCMQFLGAHPDTRVKFHFPPTCGRGLRMRWVFAHWYEEGTWKGLSQDIEPEFSPLNVEGQTRFLVNDNLQIVEMVVTRTLSEWERRLQQKLHNNTLPQQK